MCMCGEWMAYGDDGDNNGESLILLLLFEGIHTFLALWNFFRRMRCSIFSFSFLSGGYLVPLILLSDTCPFLPLVSLFLFFWGSGHLLLFISSFFYRALISWNNIASGSNQDNWSIYFTGEKHKYFWLFSLRLGVEYFWVFLEMEMGGYMWMRTSGVEAACVSESCKWILI